MSATNRGGERQTFDLYPTPGWCVEAFIKACPELPGNCLWLEPAAGAGDLIKAVNNVRQDITWWGNEIQPELLDSLRTKQLCSSYLNEDFLNPDWFFNEPPSVVITNPPYKHALEFVQRSFAIGARYVVMLLRLNFLGSQRRAAWLREHTPDVYALSKRPSFVTSNKKNRTDCTEFAWFVWDTHKPANTPGKMTILQL